MGSGKSTVGRILSSLTGFALVDTDQLLAREAGQSIPEIFREHGEKYFRTLETRVLQSLVGRIGLIVATGGGAIIPPENRALFRQIGTVVWLDASTDPQVRQIVLLDAPAVLGWERWREIGMRYGMGLVEGLLEHAITVGRLDPQPVAPLAHVLVGALDEAALYVAGAEDQAAARAEVQVVVDRLIAALARDR